VAERARIVNRLQKVLEDANMKLAAVVSDVAGVSARAMVQGLIEGETDVQALAELARGRLRSKRDALEQALTGSLAPPVRNFTRRRYLGVYNLPNGRISPFSHTCCFRIYGEPAFRTLYFPMS
jgi:transposase